LAGAVVAAPSPTAAPTAITVKPFDVFVDPPTRFAFVKLPAAGWKFVGALSEDEMRTLPDHVLTSLLPAEPERQARE
jgi:hypothetical protein